MVSAVRSGGVENDVTAFIRRTFLYARPDFPLDADARLLEHGIIDSMGVVEIVEFLQTRFGVDVRDDDITEDNLGTIGAIARYVAARRSES
jgi:acyl carrier protein